jgi:hypothetical protein
MDYNSNLVRVLILAPIAPILLILFFLFRNRLQRGLRWFVAYLSCFVIFQISDFVIYEIHKPRIYFYASWAFNGVLLALAFMVIVEILRNVLLGYEALQRIATVFFTIAGVIVIAIAIYVGQFGAPGSHPMVASMLVIERSVRIIQIGLIVAMFAFVAFVGLNWRNHVFGIALGYGLYASAALPLNAYAAYIGSDVGFKIFILEQGIFLCIIAIWMTYILQPQLAKSVLLPPSAHEDLQKWNEELAGFTRK